jgi:hypothetical protein
MSMQKAVSTIKGAKEAMENFYSAYVSGNLNKRNLRKKVVDNLRNDLPSTIMGSKNYKKAAKEIDKLSIEENIGVARKYVKDQLTKLEGQTKDTGSYGWVMERLKKYKNVK